jgi:hypothetical protein
VLGHIIPPLVFLNFILLVCYFTERVEVYKIVGFLRLNKSLFIAHIFLYIASLYAANLHSQSQNLGLFMTKTLTPFPVTKAVTTSYLYDTKHSFYWGIENLLILFFSFLWKTVTTFTMQAKYMLS